MRRDGGAYRRRIWRVVVARRRSTGYARRSCVARRRRVRASGGVTSSDGAGSWAAGERPGDAGEHTRRDGGVTTHGADRRRSAAAALGGRRTEVGARRGVVGDRRAAFARGRSAMGAARAVIAAARAAMGGGRGSVRSRRGETNGRRDRKIDGDPSAPAAKERLPRAGRCVAPAEWRVFRANPWPQQAGGQQSPATRSDDRWPDVRPCPATPA